MSKRAKNKKDTFGCFESNIIGGSLKGKKILIPNLSTTRSSKSILRESLFNTLQFDILDKVFVEVFAGSGSVGLEALSRGAKECFFIEKNSSVFQVLKENINTLHVTHATAIKGDSFEEFHAVYSHIKDAGTKSYFYFDPPFSTRDGMEDIYNKTISLIETIGAPCCEMVIIEHISSLELPLTIGGVKLKKKRQFGKSTLSYYLPLN